MVSSLSLLPSLAERYAVLLDLARTLASTLVSESLYSAIHNQVARVLPTSSFTVALAGAPRALHPVFHVGLGDGVVALGEEDFEHLRSGDFVMRATGDGRGSLLAAPLLHEDRMLGCLVAVRREGSFDTGDAHFLLAVGRLAGVALDNARLFAEAKRGREEAERLEAIARAINATLDWNEVVDRVAAAASEVVGLPAVFWMLEDDRLRAVACAGDTLVRVGDERAPPPGFGRAGEAGGEVRIDEPGGVLVPLTLGERVIGYLAIGPCPDQAPDPDRLRLLHRMVPHAASAIENARLHAEVRRLSLTDPLVQLPNRRQLDLYLEKEFAAAARGRPLSFVLYDLDGFKRYNDTHGHRAGDVALIRFADILRSETRAMNLAARYGGEEFAAVLSGTDLAGGKAYAERVRRRVYAEFDGALTVSAGVSQYTEEMKTPIDLVVAADRALYRAKAEGRNRVCAAEAV